MGFTWHLGILTQAVAHNGSLYATIPDSPSPFGYGSLVLRLADGMNVDDEWCPLTASIALSCEAV